MTELRLNPLGERIMVAASGCALVGAVAALDDTLRGRLVGLFTGEAPAEITMAGVRLQRIVRTATEAARYHGVEDTSLVFFAIAALVLVVLMLRT